MESWHTGFNRQNDKEKLVNFQFMVLETKRLLLREMNMEDYDALFRVLGDPEIMGHYPFAFDGQHSWRGFRLINCNLSLDSPPRGGSMMCAEERRLTAC